jgi:4-alpha-glucanotransferase
MDRASGILLHPTALPGKYGIGSLGAEVRGWIEFLHSAGQKLWQIYPIGPTGYGDSPYQCFSAFAGNPLLIDPEELVKAELLSSQDCEGADLPDDKVDYGKVIEYKFSVFRKAYQNFKQNNLLETPDFLSFCQKHSFWLEDYALFMALKGHFHGKPWNEWEDSIRVREKAAVKKYQGLLKEEIAFQKFIQYTFSQQWKAMRSFAKEKSIRIIGDIPIFVAMDSADAWAHPELFLFDKNLKPIEIAGVPPDYFSATGQLWGNPLYHWKNLKRTGYRFWVERFLSALECMDLVRLDHFRGFAGYWAVPFGEKTAEKGEWKAGPGKRFFQVLQRKLGNLSIIAEDLGVITPDVEELRDSFDLPGMKILQFAFDGNPENPYLPHHYSENFVVYTGTHDNDTARGWFESLSDESKERVKEYLQCNGNDIVWNLIKLAFSSVARFAIIPLQDALSLGSEARVNKPGEPCGNWQWRMPKGCLTDELAARLKKLSQVYGRLYN